METHGTLIGNIGLGFTILSPVLGLIVAVLSAWLLGYPLG
jgi:hypothetical protein